MNSPIRKLVFDEKVPLGFELLSLASTDVRSKENLRAPHRASFYLIFWFQNGNPAHIVDFSAVAVKPDSFLFIRKDAVQLFDQTNDFTSRVVLFTEDFFCLAENDSCILHTSPLFNDFRGNGRHINIASTPILNGLWTLMEHESGGEADKLKAPILQKLLSSFLLVSEREVEKSGNSAIPSGPQTELVMAFKNQLDSGFRKEKRVSYYANCLAVSDKVLTSALKSITGKTPKQLIDERVMLEAKRQLIHNRESIKTIAISLGFEEPTNFNKFFKKHSGNTPSDFRINYIADSMGAKVSS